MLELRNVTKRFNLTGNKEDLMTALDNVSLKIAPGEFVTIIGGNGSGKSTSMNIISGVMKPDKGQVLLNDVDITNLSEYERAAYFGRVFQDPMMGTSSEMSVLENLEVAYRRGRKHSPFKWGFKKLHKEKFIQELKRFDLGLETKLNQKVGLMSGGQRQALTLLMATIRNKPSYKRIKKDYILFGESDSELAAKHFDEAYETAKKQLEVSKENIMKRTDITKEDKKQKIKVAEFNFDKAIRAFDVTQQILLLDEHTAALDPKTAKKVLELTEKLVKENNMTTLMVTHNLSDALRYGNRLIMFDRGQIIHDFNAEEKAKLKPTDLYQMFSSYEIE